MRIVVTGGGSGGHITPILAVAHEIKQVHPGAKIIYLAQKGDARGDIPAQHPSIDEVRTISAGKLRRYHGQGWRQILDLPETGKNLRDIFRTIKGMWQSLWLLKSLKPDVVFIKGGFVGVPVGLASAFWRIPYVTHDSDALPGLANRIVAPWATIHAVALPKEVYRYPMNKTVTVGVPVSHTFHPVSAAEAHDAREQLGLSAFDKVLFVTGGGNGAEFVNNAVADCVPALLERYPKLAIVQVAGRSLEDNLRQYYKSHLSAEQLQHIFVKGFVTNLHQYSAAADVVISRAGGTSMAEFAAQARACVVIPNPLLAGGHQLKNAQVWAERKAAKIVDESDLRADHQTLMAPLVELLDNPERAAQYGARLHELAQGDAAKRLAMVLLEVASKK
jgi:UDP-N-acetylglucosamine--N-acetylmuramyl-(pentapeptide) pyrophosphoryl-undecaprenol N-acetylglucosamine transferase